MQLGALAAQLLQCLAQLSLASLAGFLSFFPSVLVPDRIFADK